MTVIAGTLRIACDIARRSTLWTGLGLMVWLSLAGARAERLPGWFEAAVSAEDALILPADAQAAEADWLLSDDLALVDDELLDRKVWESQSAGVNWIRSRRSFEGAYEVRARVRLMDTHGHTTVRLATGARGPAPDPASDYALTFAANRRVTPALPDPGQLYLRDPGLLHDRTFRMRETGAVTLADRFRSVSPLWAEDWRREIESAMNTLPDLNEGWTELRIVHQADGVRLYLDGMLTAERKPAQGGAGDVFLWLRRSVRVASLEVAPLPEGAPWHYHPVSLEPRVNARALGAEAAPALAAGALPPAGSRGQIDGIPFEFGQRPAGLDHIDLSQSLFRYRNLTGHIQFHNVWPAAHMVDPARITFSVPNRPYARLWLVAVHDGAAHTLPVVTARFYRSRVPGEGYSGPGFPIDAASEAPTLTASSASGDAVALPVNTAGGTRANLWLIPIELDAAMIGSELREFPMLSLELTKQAHPYRGYPDPADYGYFQGGLPSGVRVFAMTLEEAPVRLIAGGNRHANTYVAPEKPVWQVDLDSRRDTVIDAKVQLTVTDPYGELAGRYERNVTLGPLEHVRLEIPLDPALNGLHTVLTAVEVTQKSTAERGVFRRLLGRNGPEISRLERLGSFAQLPPDERQATFDNSRWGFWNWLGGHGTHANPEENYYLLRAVGARFGGMTNPELMKEWGVRPMPQHIGNDQRSAQPWAFEDPYDPEKYEENRDQIGKRVAAMFEKNPLIPSVSMFLETSITRDLTYGVPRQYIGEDPTWTEEEERRVRGSYIYGQAVTEGIRLHAPDAPIALAWGGSSFTIPLLESGFPRELFDWIGVDEPVFERTPEMPIREVTPNRVWLLRQAMLEHGYEDVPIIHPESYYPTSNPLALGHRRSADHVVRLSALSLAMIPDSYLAGCFAVHDCSGKWGNQHYGENGLVARRPEYNPKPALTAYATMTRMLDPGEYQGYLPTGSHSVYCLHFTSNDRNVYPMWTIRGRREARLRLPSDGTFVKVDEAGNEFPLEPDRNGWASVTLTPTPLWIVSATNLAEITLGATDHTFVRTEHPMMEAAMGGRRVEYRPENQVTPGEYRILLDPFETPWTYVSGPYPPHAEAHWAAPRHDGPMRSEIVHCGERNAPVWQISLEEPDVERPLTAWYGVFEPDEPILIPGKARALGVWADGRSNWGRIVYEVEDAEGEIWRSTGTNNDWNCDDIHTWSYFNYDGWRYLEFPLPSHLPYDNFREHDTTWWGSDGGDGVVQLPLKLRRIIIEHRTHNIYAHEKVAVDDRSVRLHHLQAVYDDAESMTDAPVETQRAAAGLLQAQWDETAVALPNPMAVLRESGVGEPTAFETLKPPDDYDGLVTRLEIALRSVEGAKEYRIYVAAYEDGRGAERIAHGADPLLNVSRLQPGFPLYLFATYVDADNKESKPTAAQRILLVDDFPFR